MVLERGQDAATVRAMLIGASTKRAALCCAIGMLLLSLSPAVWAGERVVCDNPMLPSSCTIVVDDAGSQGAGAAGGSSSGAGDSAGGVTSGSEDERPLGECDWRPAGTTPPANDPRWGGADPATNSLIMNLCNGGEPQYAVVPNGAAAPAAPPPPDPAVLAAQAIGQLQVPSPTMGIAPDPDRLAVNFLTYLWTQDPGPLSTTVELRGVSVTATAQLSSVTWVMGEPAKGGGPAVVTCTGAGSPPPAHATFLMESDPKPSCSYVYRLRSTADRTGGTERWPVTATATWAVTWTSNTGASGAAELTAPVNNALVRVGEYRTVGGFGPGG